MYKIKMPNNNKKSLAKGGFRAYNSPLGNLTEGQKAAAAKKLKNAENAANAAAKASNAAAKEAQNAAKRAEYEQSNAFKAHENFIKKAEEEKKLKEKLAASKREYQARKGLSN